MQLCMDEFLVAHFKEFFSSNFALSPHSGRTSTPISGLEDSINQLVEFISILGPWSWWPSVNIVRPLARETPFLPQYF